MSIYLSNLLPNYTCFWLGTQRAIYPYIITYSEEALMVCIILPNKPSLLHTDVFYKMHIVLAFE